MEKERHEIKCFPVLKNQKKKNLLEMLFITSTHSRFDTETNYYEAGNWQLATWGTKIQHLNQTNQLEGILYDNY